MADSLRPGLPPVLLTRLPARGKASCVTLRNRPFPAFAAIAVLVLATAATARQPAQQPVSGPAQIGPAQIGPAQVGPAEIVPTRVIDGMTLEIAGTRFRLFGIDAPDLDQICERRGRSLPCGEIARTALMDLVAGSDVTCTPVKNTQAPGGPAGGPVVARCSAGGFDIGRNMVHTGWALADPLVAPPGYRERQARARRRKVGLWRFSFAPPSEWRAR